VVAQRKEVPSMSYGAKTRLVSEVITAVQRQFGDESGVQLENTDIIRWINDAQDVIVAKNKVLKAKSTTAAVADHSRFTRAFFTDSCSSGNKELTHSPKGHPRKAGGLDKISVNSVINTSLLCIQEHLSKIIDR